MSLKLRRKGSNAFQPHYFPRILERALAVACSTRLPGHPGNVVSQLAGVRPAVGSEGKAHTRRSVALKIRSCLGIGCLSYLCSGPGLSPTYTRSPFCGQGLMGAGSAGFPLEQFKAKSCLGH